MSIKAILHFDGKEINAYQVQYGFKQNADFTGRPTSKPRFVGLDVVVEATKDNDFWEWIIHNYLAKQIKIQFVPRLMGGKSRIIEFIDAHCIHYTLNYNSTSKEPVTITLKITAAGVKDHSTGSMFSEHWLKTIPTNTPVTQMEEDNDPSFHSISYFDEEENEIEETRFTNISKIKVGVSNINEGESIEIVMRRENGNAMGDSSKQVTFSGIVDDGYAILEELEMKRDWEIIEETNAEIN